jgi:hypothetical protein
MESERTPLKRLQERAADRAQFQMAQAIRLRDAEIERLTKKLQEFQSMIGMDDPEMKLRHQKLKDRLSAKKMQLERAQMELSRGSLDLSESVEMASSIHSDQSSDTVDDFLTSIRTERADRVRDAAAELEVIRLNEESAMAGERIKQLQNLIGKVRARRLPSFDITESSAAPDASASEIREKHQRQIARIEQQLAEERVRTRKLRESLFRLKFASLSAINLWGEDEKNDWTVEVTRILTEGSEQERRQCLAKLLAENVRLKSEIGRIDYAIYGRAGKYHTWRVKHIHQRQTAAEESPSSPVK